MPVYQYACEKCGAADDHFQKIADAPIKKCPSCKSPEYARRFSAPNAIVRGIDSARTFGQAAEENARRVGREGIEKIRAEDRARTSAFKGKLPKGAKVNTTSPVTPPWRDGSMGDLPKMEKPLDLQKVKSTTKYIETGKAD